jgi:hypothetical protein
VAQIKNSDRKLAAAKLTVLGFPS